MTLRHLLLPCLLLVPAALTSCGSPGPEAPTEPTPEPVVVERVPEPDPVVPGRAPSSEPYAPGVDVLHYRVELDVWEGADTIAGRTHIRFRRTDAEADRITLDLTGLAVDSVWIGRSGARNLGPVPTSAYRDSLSAGRLPVPFPEGSGEGDTLAVMVRYGGTPDDGLILARTVHDTPSAFVDNWPNRARFWFPSVDHPSDKAAATFIVRAPAAWSVVANGAPLSPPTPAGVQRSGESTPRRTWRWETRAPIPTYTMVVGATVFRTREVGLAACGQAPRSTRGDGCVEVTTWLYPADTARAAPSFRRAPQMVDFFTRIFGPFPYEKLANVQSSTRFGGMENSSAIFYSESALAGGRNIEGTVAHEIAHQWFGDSVTESDWHHLWLSEGFATYFGALFFEDADGPEDFRERMEANRRRYLASEVTVRPVVDEDVEDLFALLNANNYQKGAWVLHMLRGLLGDNTFFRGIRTFYERHRDGTVLTADLRAVMEEVSGRDLEWFFRQWVFRPGHPVVSTESSWEAAAGTARITIRQTQPAEWPTFRLPLELELLLEGDEVVRRRIEVTERSQGFDLELPAAPRAVRVDPDGWILKEISTGGGTGAG